MRSRQWITKPNLMPESSPTLYCGALVEDMIDQDRALSWVPCGLSVRKRAGDDCRVCQAIRDAGSPVEAECSRHPGYQHIDLEGACETCGHGQEDHGHRWSLDERSYCLKCYHSFDVPGDADHHSYRPPSLENVGHEAQVGEVQDRSL